MPDPIVNDPGATPPGVPAAGGLRADWLDLTDAEVVARVCAGETALFELLMRRYNQRIFRVLRAILRDDAEAEDVLQECYIRAFRRLDGFEGRARVSTWLTRIGVNLALDRLRASGRLVPLEPDALEKVLDERGPARPVTPEDSHASRELAALLADAIDELPLAYRMVYVMREVEGLATRDTAECLEIEEATVKTRLHRARMRLRESLYARAGAHAEDVFPFGGERCNRVVARVLARLLARK